MQESFLRKIIVSVLVYFLFLICLFPIGVFSFKHPAYNWDMLGYMAIVIRMDGIKDIKEIHRITYEQAKENIPAQQYGYLVNSPEHRIKFASDPLYFQRVLPIYTVKPLYVWTVYIFHEIGFSLPIATVLPSILAYFLIGLLLFHWMSRYFKIIISLLLALLIMYSSFMIGISKASSPDCLSAFFLFAGFYFILEKQNKWLMFLFLMLSTITRVDNVVICFLILSLLAFSGKAEKKLMIRDYFLMLGILAISYIVIILPVRQFGWSLFYYSEYMKYMDFYRDFDKPYNFGDYFSYAVSKAITGVVYFHFTFFTFLAGLIIFYPEPVKFRSLSFDQLLALLLIFTIVIRFILLPDLSDRFYLSFYLVIIMLLIRKLRNLFRVKNISVT